MELQPAEVGSSVSKWVLHCAGGESIRPQPGSARPSAGGAGGGTSGSGAALSSPVLCYGWYQQWIFMLQCLVYPKQRNWSVGCCSQALELLSDPGSRNPQLVRPILAWDPRGWNLCGTFPGRYRRLLCRYVLVKPPQRSVGCPDVYVKAL